MVEQSWSYNDLLLLAAAASIRFAQGRSAQEVELLAAFFEVLGDNLALLALGRPSVDDSSLQE